MFADDCVIYQNGNNWDVIRTKLQSDLDAIVKWTASNSLSLNNKKTQAMIFGPRGKLLKLDNINPVTLLDMPIKFEKQYNYLGIILDSEMTLQPLVKHIKKLITNKIFNLRKIRKYINEKASILIYKQTILPITDYAGFLLLSCGVSERSDLQKAQNDILRICCKVTLHEHVSIKELHKRCKIISIEQHMQKQLLWLMYIDSRNVDNRKINQRDLRSGNKFIFKVDTKIGTKYQNSPFYKGTILWNDLTPGIQFSRDIFQFKQLVGKKYPVYEKLV